MSEKELIELFGEKRYQEVKERCLAKIKLNKKDESYLDYLIMDELQFDLFFEDINTKAKRR